MTKQIEDNRKIDLLGEPKRGRGRPRSDKPAMTAAERTQARADRLKQAGVGFLKVELPVDVLEALDRFAASKDRVKVETKSQVVERVLRSYLMRKR